VFDIYGLMMAGNGWGDRSHSSSVDGWLLLEVVAGGGIDVR
jgi:hypothetical protein